MYVLYAVMVLHLLEDTIYFIIKCGTLYNG